MNVRPPDRGHFSPVPYAAVEAGASSPGSEPVQPAPAASSPSDVQDGRARGGSTYRILRWTEGTCRRHSPVATQAIGRALVKLAIPVVMSALSATTLPLMPLAHADGRAEISPSEFQRYRSQQELDLEHEQALRAGLNPPQSLEESKRQSRQFEAERLRQELLLERQRRSVAIERAGPRPVPRSGSSRGITLQTLQREQASERLRRKLMR